MSVYTAWIGLLLKAIGVGALFTGYIGFILLVAIKRETKGTWKQALRQLIHET